MATATKDLGSAHRLPLGRDLGRAALAFALGAASAAGLAGAYGYVHSYVLYRGFGPPRPSVPLAQRGTLTSFSFGSRALAGRTVHVVVYLPPGYAHGQRRYPTVYLLHGTPGDPTTAYVNSLHVAPRMDWLIAHHRVQPMVVVMPPGSPGTYAAATEWANGPGRGEAWFSYLTHDLVRAVDSRYRVIANGRARGIGGYSSGADGALNAFLLRPGSYHVAEGWSGDYRQTPSTVGGNAALVRRFSAVETAGPAAPALGRSHAWAYLYAGRSDGGLHATLSVARALAAGGVHVRVGTPAGGHAWILWSSRLDGSLMFFSRHLEL